eukprot:285100-Prymnesium_polylepis.1
MPSRRGCACEHARRADQQNDSTRGPVWRPSTAGHTCARLARLSIVRVRPATPAESRDGASGAAGGCGVAHHARVGSSTVYDHSKQPGK